MAAPDSTSAAAAPAAFRIAGTLLLGATVACGGGGDASGTSDALPEWNLSERVRIGSVDDPDFAFSSVADLAVGPDGRVYTLHPQDKEIRIWTADGQPAGTVGREGEGPGEFQSPVNMAFSNDTLWVWDGRLHRLTAYSARGEHLDDTAVKLNLGTPEQNRAADFPPRPARRFADGTIWALTPAFSDDVVRGRLTRLVHVRQNPAGEDLDTIAVVPTSPADILGILREGRGGTFLPQPFGDGVIVTPLDDGLLITDRRAEAVAESRPEYRIVRVAVTGDTTLDRSYAYDPVPIPQERIDSTVQAQAENLHRWIGERTGVPLGEWAASLREGLHVPDHYPPVDEVVGGEDGTIWVRLTTPDEPGDRWLILEEDGEPLATLETPAEFRVLAVSTETVWGVVRDEVDVEYLVRYAVGGP